MGKVSVDLSKVDPRSISALISANKEKVAKSCASGSVMDIFENVYNIFREAHLDTPASRRLLKNIKSSKSATEAMYIVYNSTLAGCGLSADIL